MRPARKFVWIGAMAAAILTTGGRDFAQNLPGPPPSGQFGGPRQMPDDAFGFVAFEGGGLFRKTVTGAPLSANFSTQTTEVLSDGNKIQRTTSGTLSRDSQGRTRQEVTLPAIGSWATSDKTPPRAVFINDPVAQAHYVLEPDKKIARTMPAPNWQNNRKGGPFSPSGKENPGNAVTTSLGVQTVEGLTLQGTRTTRTIPAGAIGNEKPIEISIERWYSPDLQMNMIIKRSDPRTGETIFRLNNIQRQEPDASLFQVPADYAKQPDDGPRGASRHHAGRPGPGSPPN